MRITFVVPEDSLSGGQRVVALHAAGLMRRGHEVNVVARPSRHRYSVRAVVRSLLVARRALVDPSESYFTRFGVPLRTLGVEADVDDPGVPDADVVVGTWWEVMEWVMRLSPWKGAKFHFVQGDDRSAVRQPNRRIEALWKSEVPKIVVSGWLADFVRGWNGSAPIFLVPNGVDAAQFHSGERGKQEQPTVGMIYSKQPIRGCDVGFKAVRMARERVGGLRLVGFGVAASANGAEHGTYSEFVVRPPQDQLREIYGKCDVWLWPSRIEGFGLPLLEAIACRTPVIAAPTGVAPELCARGGGILVGRDDVGGMADAIVSIAGMEDFAWREMSNNAAKIAIEYNWEAATDAFENALNTGLEKRVSSRSTVGRWGDGREAEGA
jgi:glycosyltransferase involved in cell wall biosynthesis